MALMGRQVSGGADAAGCAGVPVGTGCVQIPWVSCSPRAGVSKGATGEVATGGDHKSPLPGLSPVLRTGWAGLTERWGQGRPPQPSPRS